MPRPSGNVPSVRWQTLSPIRRAMYRVAGKHATSVGQCSMRPLANIVSRPSGNVLRPLANIVSRPSGNVLRPLGDVSRPH
jgi:hypothetical protein